MFRNFKNEYPTESSSDDASQFILLSKSKTNLPGNIGKFRAAVNKARKDIICQTAFHLFIKIKHLDEPVWKRAVKRGVKFRFIVERKLESERVKLSFHPALQDANYFDVRWVQFPVPACVLLIDEKEVFCRLGLSLESPVLYSKDPCFVAMIKDYLETKWRFLETSQAEA